MDPEPALATMRPMRPHRAAKFRGPSFPCNICLQLSTLNSLISHTYIYRLQFYDAIIIYILIVIIVGVFLVDVRDFSSAIEILKNIGSKRISHFDSNRKVSATGYHSMASSRIYYLFMHVNDGDH